MLIFLPPSHPPQQVFLFGDQCILHEPPEKWPYCDALIAFYSTGFPLDKARRRALLARFLVLWIIGVD